MTSIHWRRFKLNIHIYLKFLPLCEFAGMQLKRTYDSEQWIITTIYIGTYVTMCVIRFIPFILTCLHTLRTNTHTHNSVSNTFFMLPEHQLIFDLIRLLYHFPFDFFCCCCYCCSLTFCCYFWRRPACMPFRDKENNICTDFYFCTAFDHAHGTSILYVQSYRWAVIMKEKKFVLLSFNALSENCTIESKREATTKMV